MPQVVRQRVVLHLGSAQEDAEAGGQRQVQNGRVALPRKGTEAESGLDAVPDLPSASGNMVQADLGVILPFVSLKRIEVMEEPRGYCLNGEPEGARAHGGALYETLAKPLRMKGKNGSGSDEYFTMWVKERTKSKQARATLSIVWHAVQLDDKLCNPEKRANKERGEP